MYYIIYKTVNLINNKYYVGKHLTSDLNDNYLGSGKALVASIKKYGKNNFKREILFHLNSEEEMNQKEKEIVTEELVNDPMCYNMTLGGEGGPIFLGRHHTDETKQKLKEKRAHRPVYHKTEEQKQKERTKRYERNNGKWFSEATIEKFRASAYRRHGTTPETAKTKSEFGKLTEDQRRASIIEANQKRSCTLMGHEVSVETRAKLSQANKGTVPKNVGKICINDGIKNKYVNQNELAEYLNKGYIKGQCRKPK